MPSRKAPTKADRAAPADGRADPAVAAFLRDVDHPLKAEVAALREIILGVDAAVREEIKWNAPSFRTTEHFATFNLRAKDRVRLILHLGAKARDAKTPDAEVPDPEGLLERLGKDRCMVSFASAAEVHAKRPALEAILRAWIAHVRPPRPPAPASSTTGG